MKPSTAYPRLRAYSLWTLVMITALMAFAGLTPVLHPATTWNGAMFVFTAAFVGLTVATAFLSWIIAARSVEGGDRPRLLIVVHSVLAVVSLTIVTFGPTFGIAAGAEFAVPLHVGIVAVVAFLPWATILNSRGIFLLTLAVVGLAFVNAELYEDFGGGDTTVLAALAFFAGGGMLSSVRLSIWYMEMTHKEIDSARLRADLAVAEERLRFSRDLHDIFGRTLTAVAVKSDLAAELSDHGRADAASNEMRSVHNLAEEALAEVRQVVAGYRTPDLATELLGARGLLESSGIRVRVIGEAGEGSLEVFGWVVREAVTNVIRHSKASRCEIRVSPSSVEIVNDGVQADGDPTFGSGLSGLRDRMQAEGGTLDTISEGDTFTLRAKTGEAR